MAKPKAATYTDVILNLMADDATNAMMVTEFEHHQIHEGRHFTAMHSVADIGAATTPNDAITLTFVTPDTTRWAHMILLFNAVGIALCRFREGGATGASPTGTVACFNNNRNSDIVSGLVDLSATPEVISYDAGLDTGGLLLVDEYISGATTNQNRAGGGAESGGRFEWMLKQNTRYQASIFSTATVGASIVLHWYEHIASA